MRQRRIVSCAQPEAEAEIEDDSDSSTNAGRSDRNGGAAAMQKIFLLSSFQSLATLDRSPSIMNPELPPRIPSQPPPIPTSPRTLAPSLDLRSISGTQGMSVADLQQAVAAGGRFVRFQYCVSVLVLSFKRSSPIMFVPPGESSFAKGLPYTLGRVRARECGQI